MYCNQTTNNGLTSTLQGIPDGRAGTLVTLRVMGQFINHGKKSMEIRDLAVKIVGGNGNKKDWLEQVKALQAFVKEKIRYVKDINGVETVQTPSATLRLGYGDCDDKSVLIAALLESIGHPTRLVAIGKTEDNFIHVYPETRIGTKWLSVETTESVPVGWKPEGYPAKIVFNY